MTTTTGTRPSTCPACGHAFAARLLAVRPRPVYEDVCELCDRLRRALATIDEARKLVREATELARARREATEPARREALEVDDPPHAPPRLPNVWLP